MEETKNVKEKKQKTYNYFISYTFRLEDEEYFGNAEFSTQKKITKFTDIQYIGEQLRKSIEESHGGPFESPVIILNYVLLS